MKDIFFYPLAILVITAIIGIALQPGWHLNGPTDEAILVHGVTLKGQDLTQLTAGPGTLVSYTADVLDGSYYATLSTNTPRKLAQASAGVFGTLGPKYESLFADQPLVMEVEARANKDVPLSEFDMGYFTAESGDSGWKRYTLGADYTTYTLRFTPKKGTTPGNDYYGIWPGEDGDGNAMDVRAIRVYIQRDPQAETDPPTPSQD